MATTQKEDSMSRKRRWKCCNTLRNRGCLGCIKKFLWEGQMHNKAHGMAMARLCEDLPWHKRALIQHRRAIGFAIPGILFHLFWWALFIRWNYWHHFTTKYPMTLTMIFGGTVAGMTSEGGGAVAFPVMTLALHINPSTARDFSLMIQATGMSCASFAIIFMRITIEKTAILFCSIGGWLGLIFGLHMVDPRMTPPQKKMYFVSTWFAFAFALFLLNRYHKRKTYRRIPNMNWWRVLVLLFTGFVGGIFTSFAGSGLDICSFSILTLLFRISEKVATPTSVVLMAACSSFGLYWRSMMMDVGLAPLAWEYLAVCGPIVVICAPMGAVLGSHFHRLSLGVLIYIVDTVALVAAFILIKQTPLLAGVSAAIIVAGFIFFFGLTKLGHKLLLSMEPQQPKDKQNGMIRSNTVPTFQIEDESVIKNDDVTVKPFLRSHSMGEINTEPTFQTMNGLKSHEDCREHERGVSNPVFELESVRL